MFVQRTATNSRSAPPLRAMRPAGLLFTLILGFVLAQSIGLLHQHEGDLSKRLDCQLCLKSGASDDPLPVLPSSVFSAEPRHDVPYLLTGLPAGALPAVRARGPPLFSV